MERSKRGGNTGNSVSLNKGTTLRWMGAKFKLGTVVTV